MFDWLRRYMARPNVAEELRLARIAMEAVQLQLTLIAQQSRRIADALDNSPPPEPEVVGITASPNSPETRKKP